ncbi:MAG: chromate efflux transporter [Bdellovibrio sp.]|nr:chromate efflux transporter [Bdellovibrio sp.]
MQNLIEVFLVFLRLGLTSFGGPMAHISYFHEEFVNRRRWINDQSYADLVVLCQFLPGPASSQVGIAIGLSRAGYLGAIVAWIGFTLPSALILILFGLGISWFHVGGSWLHGLKVVAVAVVAQAIWGMAIKLCPDKKRASIAVLSASVVAFLPVSAIQFFIILLGGVFGVIFLRQKEEPVHFPLNISVSRTSGAIFLSLFFLLLMVVPVIAKSSDQQWLHLFDSFYRAGSLVFGGGHVILPLLQKEVVQTGWVSKELFMTGYGAAQAIPGPLFAFTAYLGAVSNTSPSGWVGAILCLAAAFLPAFLLVLGAIPFWEYFRKFKKARLAMQGINAAVVGLLIAAFYDPVWTSAIFNSKDFALAVFCFLLLMFWKTPAWCVVLISAAAGGLFL